MMARDALVFVKLGGSVITDKARAETARPEVISRLAQEMVHALQARPSLRMVLGHGSGSFGHVIARRYGTHQGARTAAEWRGFVEVAAVAARLNRIVTDVVLQEGLPVWSLQPSASARCRGRELVWFETAPVERALDLGLVPLVHGDVGLDELQGATIISTEQIFAYLAQDLRPYKMVLVGVVDGVFDRDPLRDPSARPVPEISAENWPTVRAALSGSHATDVTGGMLAKVEAMVGLVREFRGLTVQIISGERPGALEAALGQRDDLVGGTEIRW